MVKVKTSVNLLLHVRANVQRQQNLRVNLNSLHRNLRLEFQFLVQIFLIACHFFSSLLFFFLMCLKRPYRYDDRAMLYCDSALFAFFRTRLKNEVRSIIIRKI